MFQFANPHILYLLIAIPLLVAIYIYSLYERRRRIARFGTPATIQRLMPEYSAGRHHLKFTLFCLSLTFAIFALARPQLGSKLRKVKHEGYELIFAVDVSNSMLAEDFAPNRLERTKYSIERLIEGLHQDYIGLIVFAGDAYVQLPITSDYSSARDYVQRISPNMVSKQGTALGSAIDLATNSFSSQSKGSRVIILITDGENHEDDALAAAQRAAEQGIKIYAIGMGTPEGAPIKLGDDFIRDAEGNMVVSKLDEATLQQIALSTGGAYIRSSAQSMGLAEIVEKVKQTEKGELTQTLFAEYKEQYHLWLAIALGLLIIEMIILPRRNPLFRHLNIFHDKQ